MANLLGVTAQTSSNKAECKDAEEQSPAEIAFEIKAKDLTLPRENDESHARTKV